MTTSDAEEDGRSLRLHFIRTWRNQYRNRFPSSSKGFKSTEPNLSASTGSQKAAIIHIDMVAGQFYDILHTHFNKVQAVSCDEAFLDVTDVEGVDPEVLASTVRSAVFLLKRSRIRDD
ncbi:DNA repair protein REV1-like [Pyrus ussuriensis x Pyrus communis]|uniref:DNA repair protein REV1-like n=1 Tax=Pyrus ussuriensis x Pyrus communis TaxID=2448454 RepID=A0A5N5IBQ1_9ROSA|nr:DNA repair protein REV1-like [Pyrus ussuriensis x Pyrus communis]